MKLFNSALLLLAGVLSFTSALTTEELKSLPSCAQSCYSELVPESACDASNATCICTDVELNQKLTACIPASCTVRESLVAFNTSLVSCGAPVRDTSSSVFDVACSLGPISLLVVILRMVTKLPQFGSKLGWDDGWMLLAAATSIPFTVINGELGLRGLGKDVWTLTPTQITTVLQYYFVEEVLYVMIPPMIKQSILHFYLRIFPDRTFRRITLIVMTINFILLFGFVCMVIFQCSPISLAWTGWDGSGEGKCTDVNAMGWAGAGVTLVFDLVVTILPLKQLYQLNLNWRRKLQLLAMFGVGTFVTLVSAIRIQTLAKFANTHNPTFDYVPLANWSMVEVFVGIICACMPSLRSLYVSLTTKKRVVETMTYGNGTMGGMPRVEKSLTLSVSDRSNSSGSRSLRKPGFGPNAGFMELHDLEKEAGVSVIKKGQGMGVTTTIFSDATSPEKAPSRQNSARKGRTNSSDSGRFGIFKGHTEVTVEVEESLPVERRGNGILKTKQVEVRSDPVTLGAAPTAPSYVARKLSTNLRVER